MAASLASLDCRHISVAGNGTPSATRFYYATLERRKGMVFLKQITARNGRSSGFKVFAEANVSRMRTSRAGPKDVVMVDPIEAKRLAAEQMQKLQARAKSKRQRAIEAINGGWAMLGLTAAIVIEGYTGKTILSQVAGYLNMLADVLDNYLPLS